MAPERRTQIVWLSALAAALVVVVYLLWPRPSASASAASNGRSTPGAASSAGAASTGGAGAVGGAGGAAGVGPERATQVAPGDQAPDVHLKELEAERTKPSEHRRNLFRFKPPPAPPTPPPTRRVEVEAPVVLAGPTPTPPPPPITLKFVGTTEVNGATIAVLIDPQGHVDYGREGEIIAGRYRILKIGVESLDIAYLDGTGRRTIRKGG